MKATVSKTPSRDEIAGAISVLEAVNEALGAKFTEIKERWISDFQKRAWFGKSLVRAHYHMDGALHYLYPRYFHTASAQLASLELMLKKYDLADRNCEALSIVLEDEELKLLVSAREFWPKQLAELTT